MLDGSVLQRDPMAFRLLELVDELVLSIVERLDDVEDLRRLARTCSRMQALTEPLIYENVLIRSRQDALALASSIVSRPDRVQAIRSVDSRYGYRTRDYRLDVLVDIVRAARNMRELTIESPFCNFILSSVDNGWAENMRALLKPVCEYSIPRLTKLTLHLSLEESRYWTIDQGSALIFCHPTLRSLSMSCATVSDAVVRLLDDRPYTPLKHLAFIECNITYKALDSILALPVALEVLSLGENCHHSPPSLDGSASFNQLWSKNTAAFVEALKHQQETLKTFAYATLPWEPAKRLLAEMPTFNSRASSGFSTFPSLTSLSLEGCCLEYADMLTNPLTAPPNLQQLRLIDTPSHLFRLPWHDSENGPDLPWFLAPCKTIHTLQKMELVAEHVKQQTFTDAFAGFAHVLKESAVSIELWSRRTRHAVPPILYNERPGEERLLFSVIEGKLSANRQNVVRPLGTGIEYS